MRRFFAAAICALATPLWGQTPSSAIDWLSNALENPPRYYIPPPTQTRPQPEGALTITPLDSVTREAAGLIPANVAGFDQNMWADTPAQEAIDMLMAHRLAGMPEAHALYRRLLLAQTEPPVGASPDLSPLVARVDQLFTLGALDEAETLILQAGVAEAALFRRWFEISLLVGRTVAPCAALRQTPALADDLSIRVICLARAGDWNAAATSVSLGAALGEVEEPRADLLIRFLDPALFEDAPDPAPPVPMTPIDFALREALALPRPLGRIDPPYLFGDLALSTPLRQRMEAAERLVESAAITPPLLFSTYRAGRPASSGGIWGRAEAVQALDRALSEDDDTALALAFDFAMQAFAEPSLMAAFAYEYGLQLATRSPSAPLEPVGHDIQRILLLAGADAPLWFDQWGTPDSALELARRIFLELPLPMEDAPSAPLMRAVYAAFAEQDPSTARAEAAQLLIRAGRQAPAVLMALDLLAEGADASPADIHLGLWMLCQAGQETAARRIAIQLLLLERAGA